MATEFRCLSHERARLLATWLVVLAAGTVTYCLLRSQPFYWDAEGYTRAAQTMADRGLLNRWYQSDIRTYGYPLFLTVAFKIAGWLHVGRTAGIFAAQWSLFVGSAWLTARSLFRQERLRLTAFALLAANPLLLAYTAQALTESLSLSLLLLAVAALGRAARGDSHSLTSGWLVTGALASAFDMEVRPGNFPIPVCYAIAAAGIILRTVGGPRQRAAIATAVLVLAGLVGPLIPQVLINQRNYNRVTPLPTFDLTGLQTTAGLKYLRYATNVSSECGGPRLYFLNPDKPRSDVTTTEALRYYALRWPEGPETAALHIFSSVDPRPFLTYQHEFGAGYERWLQAYTVALMFFAGFALPTALKKIRGVDGGLRLDATFLGLVTLVLVLIIAMSAAEYRFGVIPIAAVSLLAALGTSRLRRPTWQLCSMVGLGYVCALLLWMTLSDLVLATSVTWQHCS